MMLSQFREAGQLANSGLVSRNRLVHGRGTSGGLGPAYLNTLAVRVRFRHSEPSYSTPSSAPRISPLLVRRPQPIP